MTRSKKIFAVLAALALVSGSMMKTARAIETPSGMLLGVHAFQTWKGLRIHSTIPGYSAEGRLFPSDVLLRASDGTNIYSIKSHPEIEWAKEQIGPNRQAALELWRPGTGIVYVWVTFRPIGGAPAAAAAVYATEAERPGASQFFSRSGNGPQPQPAPQPQPVPGPQPAPGHGPNPQDFFRGGF